jgi:hypothetical protein
VSSLSAPDHDGIDYSASCNDADLFFSMCKVLSNIGKSSQYTVSIQVIICVGNGSVLFVPLLLGYHRDRTLWCTNSPESRCSPVWLGITAPAHSRRFFGC